MKLATEPRIVLDVWGGPLSMDHIARFLPTIEAAWDIAKQELAAGFLVNLRLEHAWGSMTPFDHRTNVPEAEGVLQ